LTEDLLTHFKRNIESWTMIPSDKGRFEIVVGETLIFSKLQERRFPSNQEVIKLIEKHLAKK